ncbi:MAG: hypothetical protein COB02_15380 [Candidatus Cloacimonadota bacterium]|nr:MAG: hypothetical protein COB02_15380 [Candidatus Cloacimonadota bacterium]
MNTKAFTMVELMIAMSIFTICILGLYRLSGTVGKNTVKTIQELDATMDIAQVYMVLRKRLAKVDSIHFPPLKVNSKELSFYIEGDRFDYEFKNNSIQISKNQKLISTIVKGLKLFEVYRLDTKLMQIKFVMKKNEIETRLYLENLK